MYDSKPSLTTLMKYVDQQFDEKGGKIQLPPGIGVTPFQRQAMLAREIELLIERDGQARIGLDRMNDAFVVIGIIMDADGKIQDGYPATYEGYFMDNGWDATRDTSVKIWTITPGKEGE